MRNFKDKVAVITGAGSGIGRALAQTLAGEGCQLALMDKNPSGLKETLSLLGNTIVQTWVLDITQESAVRKFAKNVEKKMGPADIVINNAGINIFGSAMETSTGAMKKVMDVNYWGTIFMTQAFLPQLLRRPESSLVNISSTLGLRGFFGQAAYSASKFAVRGFTEALQVELKDTPVQITLVYPGGVKTKIHQSAINEYPMSMEERKQAVKEMDAKSRCTPDQAAGAIVKGIRKEKPRVLIGIDALGIDYLSRLFPDNFDLLLQLSKKRDPFLRRMGSRK